MSAQLTIQDLKLHDHTILFFKDQSEFFHCLVPFIRDGIKNNERCYIVLDEIAKEEVYRNYKNVFREGHIPPESFSNKGSIVIFNFSEVYTPDDQFDAEKIISRYIDKVQTDLKNGYSGVRVFAEVSKTISLLKLEDRFLSYERKVDPYFLDNKFCAVCAYNTKCVSESFTRNILQAHPVEIDLMRTRF